MGVAEAMNLRKVTKVRYDQAESRKSLILRSSWQARSLQPALLIGSLPQFLHTHLRRCRIQSPSHSAADYKGQHGKARAAGRSPPSGGCTAEDIRTDAGVVSPQALATENHFVNRAGYQRRTLFAVLARISRGRPPYYLFLRLLGRC